MTLLLISNTFHASGDFITYRLWTNVTHSSSIYIIHFEQIPHIILVSLLLASTKSSTVFQCFFSQIWKDCIIPRNHPLMTSTINGQFFDPMLPRFTLFKLGQNWKVCFMVSPNSRDCFFEHWDNKSQMEICITTLWNELLNSHLFTGSETYRFFCYFI